MAVRNAAGPNGEDVVSEVTGEAFLPADPEIFIYDDDGNLIEDGQWTYEWDTENRLIAMETRLELSSLIPRQRLEFGYDWLGRRIRKTVKEYASTWQTLENRSFHYHGWNLVAEIDAAGTVEKNYLWGLDLSGTLDGAGGVGGLLAIRDHIGNETFYPAYDGNGNVTGLIDSTDATVATIYGYGPFGEAIRASGPAAAVNPFRFSTKYLDAETDLYYYGYRYYSPSMGWWLNRDPIGEQGGLNLYAFVGNDPLNQWDYLGLIKDGGNKIKPPSPSDIAVCIGEAFGENFFNLVGKDIAAWANGIAVCGAISRACAAGDDGLLPAFGQDIDDPTVLSSFAKCLAKKWVGGNSPVPIPGLDGGLSPIFNLRVGVDISYSCVKETREVNWFMYITAAAGGESKTLDLHDQGVCPTSTWHSCYGC